MNSYTFINCLNSLLFRIQTWENPASRFRRVLKFDLLKAIWNTRGFGFSVGMDFAFDSVLGILPLNMNPDQMFQRSIVYLDLFLRMYLQEQFLMNFGLLLSNYFTNLYIRSFAMFRLRIMTRQLIIIVILKALGFDLQRNKK